MLRRAAFNLRSLATHAHFHLHRKRKRAIGKETKHKVRTSDKRKLPIMQPHWCSPDPALIRPQPRSWDILQFSALAAHYRNCRCFFVSGYHLGVRHFLAALTAGPLPSAHSASVNFSAVVAQKLPLHHLLSYVCKMRQNFKPVHGHGDFQRVTGELRECIYAFPLQVSMFFNLLMRFVLLERWTS